MNNFIIDNIVVFFSIVYYFFLCVVFVLRAYGRDAEELKLAPVFSLLLVPFVILWVLNWYIGVDGSRLIAVFLIILYLSYDLWYRLLTKRKPLHHPNRLPFGLIMYIILLQLGSIDLKFYGFLVGKVYGNALIISYWSFAFR